MSLLAYFLLTFLITWAVWFAAAALAAPGNTGLFGIRGPVFLLGVSAPALVSLALTARAEGPAGVKRLLARIGHWRVGARWYVFAVGYFAAIKLTAALVHRVATNEWPRFGDTHARTRMLGGLQARRGTQGDGIPDPLRTDLAARHDARPGRLLSRGVGPGPRARGGAARLGRRP